MTTKPYTLTLTFVSDLWGVARAKQVRNFCQRFWRFGDFFRDLGNFLWDFRSFLSRFFLFFPGFVLRFFLKALKIFLTYFPFGLVRRSPFWVSMIIWKQTIPRPTKFPVAEGLYLWTVIQRLCYNDLCINQFWIPPL